MSLGKDVALALQITALPWIVYALDLALPIDLRAFGLLPRSAEGLRGIFFAPFLHSGLSHLAANTGALFVLLVVSLSYSRKLTYRALLIIILGGGSLVWLLGKGHSLHIGSSGVIFGLIGFLLFIGAFRREWKALVVSVLVAFLYGGALLSLLVQSPGISWAGHFYGFITGAMAASWMKRVPLGRSH